MTIERRLRQHAREVLDPGYPFYGTPELVREAADTIDRLRAEVARLKGKKRCRSLSGKK